jgi:hypothetical protein
VDGAIPIIVNERSCAFGRRRTAIHVLQLDPFFTK